ncbi:MAG: GNAT family N-acetyltransferase [Hyphomicrobiales bacterium]|nr:GNAT family N-acetyltransferase [Hyphomicrobiales bacterium]
MSFIQQDMDYFRDKPDKRQIPRVKLATIVSMDSSKWDLELSKPKIAPELEMLLDKYQDDCLEDNPFFEKPFLAAAFGRMNTRETILLTVWETIDNQRLLRMYFPVVKERVGVPGKKTWRCWSHDYAPLGVPIVSKRDAEEVLDRFLQLISQVVYPGISTLVFQDVPLDGLFAVKLRDVINDSRLPYRQISTSDRAVLQRNLIDPSSDILEVNAKMRRNYRRQLRRLGETGELVLERVDEYQDIILRFEEFLLLEASGWKKRQGTSMLTTKQTAAFARQAVTELAKSGQSAVYSIRLEDKTIASLIMLKSGGAYFPWKIAIDQNYSHYSPGALLIFRISQALGAESEFFRADSLAAASSQLVNPIWKQRMELGSLVLPIGTEADSSIEQVSRAIERKAKLRTSVKKNLKQIFG